MLERTLAIIKPGAVRRKLMGEVIKRIEQKDLKIVAMKMIWMTRREAHGFYKAHEGQPYFEGLTEFMSSGPVVVVVLEGEDAIARYRKLMGATDHKKAEEGTIRKEFAIDIQKNVVHGSDCLESADWEIGYFFNSFEIVG